MLAGQRRRREDAGHRKVDLMRQRLGVDGGPGKHGSVLGYRKKDLTIIGDICGVKNLPPMSAVVQWDNGAKFFYSTGFLLKSSFFEEGNPFNSFTSFNF